MARRTRIQNLLFVVIELSLSAEWRQIWTICTGIVHQWSNSGDFPQFDQSILAAGQEIFSIFTEGDGVDLGAIVSGDDCLDAPVALAIPNLDGAVFRAGCVQSAVLCVG
jgi:hypothetical protein